MERTNTAVATSTGTDFERMLAGDSATYEYKVKLEAFEGPLDLLLFLIKRDEIDVYNIPIARITSEYLTYIQALEELNVDVAGEFLLMAATLIHIKSHLLLPADPTTRNDNGDPTEDPRSDLVRRLLEHQKYKRAAHQLWSLAEVEQAVYTKPIPEQEVGNEVVATVFDLLETFRKILERKREKVEMEIARDEVTQVQKMVELKTLLAKKKVLNVRELFEAAHTKREMICIFLAILELVKETLATMVQEKTFGDILIKRVSQ